MITKIEMCRACKNNSFRQYIDLGSQPLSGVFPLPSEQDPLTGPLILIKCDSCNLVQLGHNFPLDLMYGMNYGYASSLNSSMASHLERKVNSLFDKFFKHERAIDVIDIGANDGSLLRSIKNTNCNLYAVDPTIALFLNFYDDRPDIIKIIDFFDGQNVLKLNPKKFDLVTSISMLYDLQDPKKFVEDISLILKDDGLWHTEQSYLFSMMDSNAFDTICHEHLEYYSLLSIETILSGTDLRVIDVSLNKTNGGSFALTIAKTNSKHKVEASVDWLRLYESKKNLDTELSNFTERVKFNCENLFGLITTLRKSGKIVAGIGASTKGNVLLNFLELSNSDIPFIADVNKLKHGKVTPGSRIPIISEEEFRRKNPDFALVLPWHYHDFLVKKEEKFLTNGGRLIFPMPNIQIIDS